MEIKDISIEQLTAKDNDYLVLQDPDTGISYKITKSNLLAASVPIIPTYINLPLIETSGTDAIDISGNNRNATYVNCNLNTSGVLLDGSSRISLNSPNNALTALSVGIEFKTSSSFPQGLWEFRASQDLSSGVFTPALIINSSGNLAIYGYPSGSSYSAQSYSDNVWHKSIVAMSNNSIKMFVDKVKILDINANPITAFSGFFSIGSTRSNGNFIGEARKFRVWDFVLSDSQLTELS